MRYFQICKTNILNSSKLIRNNTAFLNPNYGKKTYATASDIDPTLKVSKSCKLTNFEF